METVQIAAVHFVYHQQFGLVMFWSVLSNTTLRLDRMSTEKKLVFTTAGLVVMMDSETSFKLFQ